MDRPETNGEGHFGDALDLLREQRGASASGPQPRLPAGTRLGRYSLIEPLGSGGMGVVYRAHDEKLERIVAIKMLAAGVLTGEDARRYFRREALALAKLNHPNIATVYDVGEQDGLDYIVMELVQGESLAAKLRTGRLEVREATTIVLEVAEALEEAHEQGVIHRDLKPANVMITPKGHAKVLDFGLAKLLAETDATLSFVETRGVVGTPQYMSPEQAMGKNMDRRTDLWSLGAVYYESLTGRAPFVANTGLAVMRAITDEPLKPVRQLRPDVPEQAEQLVSRALEKDPTRRYQTATEIVKDASDVLLQMSGTAPALQESRRGPSLAWWVAVVTVLLACAVAGFWLYRRAMERRWATEEAIPQIKQLVDERKPLAAFSILKKAQGYLPGDEQLQRFEKENSTTVTITSDPPGAKVEIQDYLTPNGEWLTLGTTPLSNIHIPTGYFRWRVSKAGVGSVTQAPESASKMNFPLAAEQKAPVEMVFDPGSDDWTTYSGFLGWLGPYNLPPFYVDRYEVTNRDYQKFVDSGGYIQQQYWPATFKQNGRTTPWSEAMAQFRDTTGRPGPSTWAGGHYQEGRGDLPVSGVSWFEATAYAAYAGKALPVLGQWYQTADPDKAEYIVPLSNLTGKGPAAGGTFKGVGPFGTYDMAGNVREWTANTVDNDLRFILGGSWKSQSYLFVDPEALSPFDRSDGNGFRCVRNLGAMPEKAAEPFHRVTRDFTAYKPITDAVFRAYELIYDYAKAPLNAKEEGVVKETADWREEKVSFDTAYNGERMAAYLFLPKRVRPPYQTVLFFPSARVFLSTDSSELGDVNFFDYIVQSGRAVMYPVYQDTYERRLKNNFPSASQAITLTTEWYKDAARSLDYLNTRADIDSGRLAYLGVSMGSADGVIVSTLLQDRLKTAIYLDGGYFLQPPPPGGDQADFATRMKKPVLMVNGRYDYTFPVETAQNPMFQMLGTSAAEKSHVILDTPHDVTEQRSQLIKVVLNWLDRYLGRVSE